MTAQEHAIAMVREAYRAEVLPIRQRVSDLIDQMGWRRARPIIEEVLGTHATSPRGGWWAGVDKRTGPRLVAALENRCSEQGVLF